MIKIVKNASVCDPTLLGDSVVTDKSSVLFLVPRLLIEGQRSKNKQIFENCKQTRARTSARFQKINKIKDFTKIRVFMLILKRKLTFFTISYFGTSLAHALSWHSAVMFLVISRNCGIEVNFLLVILAFLDNFRPTSSWKCQKILFLA